MGRLSFILIFIFFATTAVQAQSSKEDKQVFSFNMKKAKKGDAEAQRLVGLAYRQGVGVKKNDSKAIEWLEKAAMQGDVQAQLSMGDYFSTTVVTFQEALKWYGKAADQGSVKAMMALGQAYASGNGVAKDPAAAFRWYLKAAGLGDALSQKEVGARYYEGDGTAQDYAESFRWYMKAAVQGDPVSQNMVGRLYYDGKGTAKELKEAAKWYRLSAENGNVHGQVHLAVCYINGEGVEKDIAEGAKWMERAAAQGNKAAAKWYAAYRQQMEQAEKIVSWLDEVKHMTTHASAYIYGEPRDGEDKPVRIWQKTKNGYFYNGSKIYGDSRFRGEAEGYGDPFVSCLPNPYTKCTFTVGASTIRFTFEDAIQTDCQFKRVRISWGGESDDPVKPRDFMKEDLGCRGGTTSLTGYVYAGAEKLKLKITNTCTHKIYQTPRKRKLSGRYSNGTRFEQGYFGSSTDPFAPWRSVHNQTTVINIAESARMNGLAKADFVKKLLGSEKWILNKSGQQYIFSDEEKKVMAYFLWNTFGLGQKR